MTGKILYRVGCDHPDCTEILGGDAYEWWTARSLVPLADNNGWTFDPVTGTAYCPEHGDAHAPR